MRILLAGAAALALAASGAHAQPGNGKGNEGNGNGKAKDRGASQMERGKPDRRPNGAANGNNRAALAAPSERRAEKRDERRAERRDDREARDPKARLPQGRDKAPALRQEARRESRQDNRSGRNFIERARYTADREWVRRDSNRTLIDGCPPGLAKKRNGCLPPGQAKKRDARYERWNGYSYRPGLFGLTNYGSGRYFYDNGYLLKAGTGGGIAGFIPLLGGALAVGNSWPSSYASYNVPDYYVDYYDLGQSASYRYADNVIYRVDPEDAAIVSVAALLTGDDFAIGQQVPSGYDVYNVPYAYRDRYYDTPDAQYRYSDGYVYQIDPETRLIAAAIDLLI